MMASSSGRSSTDSGLEEELGNVAEGDDTTSKAKSKTNPNLLPASDLEKMVAESMRDIGSDDDEDVDDVGDEDLLAELDSIADGGDNKKSASAAAAAAATENEGKEGGGSEVPKVLLSTTTQELVNIILHRIEIYKQAEAIAKANGEGCKERRFNRALKTLHDLLKQANAGGFIEPESIPPEIHVHSNETDDVDNKLIEEMRSRQQEYEDAALQAKKADDTEKAAQFQEIFKKFDDVIKMCEEGKKVDLSDMPPPPSQFKEFMEKMKTPSQ